MHQPKLLNVHSFFTVTWHFLFDPPNPFSDPLQCIQMQKLSFGIAGWCTFSDAQQALLAAVPLGWRAKTWSTRFQSCGTRSALLTGPLWLISDFALANLAIRCFFNDIRNKQSSHGLGTAFIMQHTNVSLQKSKSDSWALLCSKPEDLDPASTLN